MAEKRKNVRIDKQIVIRYLRENDRASLFSAIISQNVSDGGFCIKTDYKLGEGSTIIIRFHLPNTRNYQEAEAVVKWIRPIYKNYQYETGIQFVDKEKEIIRAFQ